MKPSLPLLALLFPLAAACDLGEGGSGVLLAENRPVGAFTSFELDGAGTVEITVDPERADGLLRVSGDDNILPLVETKVEDGRLHIRPVRSIRPDLPLRFQAVVSTLEGVILKGAGDIRVEGIDADTFRLDVSGTGSIHLEGRTGNLEAGISGAASLHAAGLHSRSATIRLSGAGKAEVHASQELHAKVSGVGTITCHGKPAQVDQSVSGVGSVRVVD